MKLTTPAAKDSNTQPKHKMAIELQEKAKWVSEIYAAVANGDTLQIWHSDTEEWRDATNGPNLTCREDWWRIKPKPRRMWTANATTAKTDNAAEAETWKEQGHTVTEWMEVLP